MQLYPYGWRSRGSSSAPPSRSNTHLPTVAYGDRPWGWVQGSAKAVRADEAEAVWVGSAGYHEAGRREADHREAARREAVRHEGARHEGARH